MKKAKLLLIILAIIFLIAGCGGGKTGTQTKVGKLILNQGKITTIKVQTGATKQTTIPITDPTVIADLLSKVQKISVNRLTKDEDIGFMRPRIIEESILNVSFYTNYDYLELMVGMFFIWPDGSVYAVDVETMRSNQRTIAYLSEAKHVDLYKWLSDKIGQPVLATDK